MRIPRRRPDIGLFASLLPRRDLFARLAIVPAVAVVLAGYGAILAAGGGGGEVARVAGTAIVPEGGGAWRALVADAAETANAARQADIAEMNVTEAGGVAAGAAADAPAPSPEEPAEPEAAVGLRPEPWAAPPQWDASPPPGISATTAVVLDEASAAVMYNKDAYSRRGPASLTKIVTAILAVERGDLDEVVEVDVDSRRMPGSSVMGLRPGDRFSLRDLVYGLMLPSGNDAALAIGRRLAGSDQEFARQMTAFAQGLGLTDTQFMNPHGLSAEGHFTSAYDLAILARYMMSIPELREVVATPEWTAQGSRRVKMRTYNKLLGKVEGVDGVKTGFTRSAGRTFVVSATRGGHRVYVVLLNAPDREADAQRLLEWAFNSYRWPDGG